MLNLNSKVEREPRENNNELYNLAVSSKVAIRKDGDP